MITQIQLKELFHYCPEFGLFTRLVRAAKCTQVGDIAGGKNSGGYLDIMIYGRTYKSHRLAFLYMTGEFPPHDVDHINGVRDDNRWENLRAVTKSENSRNMKLRSTNTSGHVGVHWHNQKGKWEANYGINNKRYHLGCFADINDAIAARETVSHLFHENHGRILQKLN
jgi:hypothetical protein